MLCDLSNIIHTANKNRAIKWYHAQVYDAYYKYLQTFPWEGMSVILPVMGNTT